MLVRAVATPSSGSLWSAITGAEITVHLALETQKARRHTSVREGESRMVIWRRNTSA